MNRPCKREWSIRDIGRDDLAWGNGRGLNAARQRGGNTMIEIPVREKYALTIEEAAAAYFCIGENKLRRVIAADSNADYICRTERERKLKARNLRSMWTD